jgi:hypothetical protein
MDIEEIKPLSKDFVDGFNRGRDESTVARVGFWDADMIAFAKMCCGNYDDNGIIEAQLEEFKQRRNNA